MRLQPGDWMKDVDRLLAVINNPTRRRIMEALVREPHYSLQLAKELRVSQPAIIKHLNTLEESGLVSSYAQSSDRGPERKQYVTSSEFTLVVDMRDGMFSARLMAPKVVEEMEKKEKKEKKQRRFNDIMEARNLVALIDDEIEELERKRSEMVDRRREIISAAYSLTDLDDEHYRARALMYEMMDNPKLTMEEMARRLSMNSEECSELLEDMMNATVQYENRKKEVNHNG